VKKPDLNPPSEIVFGPFEMAPLRRSCLALLNRSLTKPKKKPSDQALAARMEQICLEYSRYGYRRVTKQLQREGWVINHFINSTKPSENYCSI